MTLQDIHKLLSDRMPIDKVPIEWESSAYTTETFNRWVRDPNFTGWPGDLDTEEEVRSIAILLKPQPGDDLLDVACGYGRHALAFTDQYNLRTTGIDISPALIAAARRFAEEKGLEITYEVKHAKELAWFDAFDLAMIVFNSFSLFSPEDAPVVLEGIHQALRPNGRLFIDLDNKPFNCRYGTSDTNWDLWPRGLTLQEIYFHDDLSVEVCRDLSFEIGVDEMGEFIFIKRLYTLDEISDLISSHGFRIDQIYGGWDLSSLDKSSSKMILVCVKE